MSVSFGEKGVKTKYQYRYPKEEPLNDKEHVYTYLAQRHISQTTVDAVDVREDAHGNIVFNYYDTNDVLCLVKYRPSHKIDKANGEIKAWCQKDADTTPLLFNMNRVNTTSPLLICEGEIDCMAAIEAGFTNAVSVPLGANNYGWIEENFNDHEEKIISSNSIYKKICVGNSFCRRVSAMPIVSFVGRAFKQSNPCYNRSCGTNLCASNLLYGLLN